jgi:hypothetical protein
LLDPRFPKKSLWVSWILDPGLLDPRFPKKSFCSGLVDPRFHKKNLWASWILDPSLRDPRFHKKSLWESREVGTLGSLNPKSEHPLSSFFWSLPPMR